MQEIATWHRYSNHDDAYVAWLMQCHRRGTHHKFNARDIAKFDY